jgi:sulfite exporter TauE/SafE
MSLFLAAITLGLLGSFHCIGMCGPIALALPVNHYAPLKKYTGIILYNAGRISTYTVLGLLFGLLGQSFFLGGFQQVVSISIGVLLLFSVILPKFAVLSSGSTSFLYSFVSSLKSGLGKLFGKKGLHVLFLIGLLNGLLPCGLVYLGIAGAIASGNYLKGAEFMLYFGLGTAPIMFIVPLLGQFVSIKYRNAIRKSMPLMVSIMAIMLIIRGLNLGIPYLSPQFEKQSNTVSCCEKNAASTANVSCSTKPCH